ncbi:hypothetical protein AM493_15525 [Flavobacterium akiainvivens]|uniref:Uncharacterized protein n=2 Tax=Flavobacterium akiainvivens TaxID=1202724 RepID=A0A0M8MJ61_9FLAO|nr:hypothetical protein [Flavobacterium akiainvivens]KOS07291.1 hypothetical protein AM493_15525 [Flavobacterium akiainvivens]SFQ46265.1 hypothetical protein SAMN05444144_10587 [Flavobacterium akiainvivens]
MNPNKKWVYVQDATLKHPYSATMYMKFDKETCENVFLESGYTWTKIDGPEEPDNWKYDASKNTLDMYGQFLFTITKFSADTIYMVNQKNRQKAYFINFNVKSQPATAITIDPEPLIIKATYPFTFKNANINDPQNFISVNDGINAKINEVVRSGCNSPKYNPEQHIAAFQLRDSLYTLYVVTTNGCPTGELSAQVLFYNNITKTFIDNSYQYKLFANYEYANNRFKPSDLRKRYKINGPDIEKLDYNHDGVTDYKFTRLWHNGTFNALSTTVLSVAKGQIDTLYSKEVPYPVTE